MDSDIHEGSKAANTKLYITRSTSKIASDNLSKYILDHCRLFFSIIRYVTGRGGTGKCRGARQDSFDNTLQINGTYAIAGFGLLDTKILDPDLA